MYLHIYTYIYICPVENCPLPDPKTNPKPSRIPTKVFRTCSDYLAEVLVIKIMIKIQKIHSKRSKLADIPGLIHSVQRKHE